MKRSNQGYSQPEPSAILKKSIGNLMQLVEAGRLDDIKDVVAEEEKSNRFWRSEDNTWLAVCKAISLNQLEIVRFFLDAGVSADVHTMLPAAARSGHLRMVRLLVEHGVEIKPSILSGCDNTNHKIGIVAAVESGNVDIVTYLLENGSSPNARCNGTIEGFTSVLAEAAQSSNIPVVESLLNYDASVGVTLSAAHEQLQYALNRLYGGLLMTPYSDLKRKKEILYGFGCYGFEFRESKSEAKTSSLDQLNNTLSNLESFNESKKENAFNLLIPLLAKYNISFSKDQLTKKLEALIIGLKAFDAKKKKVYEKRHILKTDYHNMVEIILDYAIGTDFRAEKKGICHVGTYGGLSFLKQVDVDISGFNFIGISIAGKPITRKMLAKVKLKGADMALVSIEDLAKLKDKPRREALKERLEKYIKKHGDFQDELGIVSLVSLRRMAKVWDKKAVEARSKAGVGPSQNWTPAILAATAGRHSEDGSVDMQERKGNPSPG